MGLSLAEKAKRLREEHHWTLSQLSAQTGISMSHLSAIEKGTRPNPSFDMMCRLARTYGLSLDYFAEDPIPGTVQKEGESTSLHDFPGDAENRAIQPDIRAFLAADHAGPYLALARHLAKRRALENTTVLLESIAEFLTDRQAQYAAIPASNNSDSQTSE